MNSISNAISQDLSDSAVVELARHSVDEVLASAEALTTQGTEAIKDTAEQAREVITQKTDEAAEFVQAQPLKALLIAAAAGAAIALLAGALSKQQSRN